MILRLIQANRLIEEDVFEQIEPTCRESDKRIWRSEMATRDTLDLCRESLASGGLALLNS
jgi:hypothetical protein